MAAWARLFAAFSLSFRPSERAISCKYGTRLLNAGVPIHQVQKWHGHANASQTLAYAHASVDDLRAAVAAVAP